MKKLYIFKVGKTFENTKKNLGDFTDWIKNFTNSNKLSIEVIDILNNDKLPQLKDSFGVIITGSHSMVTDNLEWSVNIEQWIKKAINHPIYILGICYGHQLIGKALGANVNNNPKGKEIGTVTILSKDEINKDPLFKDTPLNFKAHVTHMQSVLTLPKGAKSLAFNSHDENQIVRFSDYIWGVQFHPEFDEDIMKEYIKEQKDELQTLGFNINELLTNVDKTDYANTLIDNFVRIIKNKI